MENMENIGHGKYSEVETMVEDFESRWEDGKDTNKYSLGTFKWTLARGNPVTTPRGR